MARHAVRDGDRGEAFRLITAKVVFFRKTLIQAKSSLCFRVMISLLAQRAACDGHTRTRVNNRTKKSATSATGDYNKLKHNTLWVHFDFWKMLLEKLLAGVSSQLHTWVLLCSNETYRKVAAEVPPES